MKKTLTANDIEKLPKWARDEMARLERELVIVRRELDAKHPEANIDDPGTLYYCHSSKTNFRKLPEGKWMWFNHGGMTMNIGIRHDSVEVTFSTVDGRDEVFVEPMARNSLWFTTIKKPVRHKEPK